MMDVGALTASLSDDAPSGPDLYGDHDRQAIEAAFERSISADPASGDGAGIDDGRWRDTIRLILGQAEKTRDLWLPVYLMRAAAQAGDLATLVDGAQLLAGLLEERWADVHPQLDEVGFIGRKAPCESLTRIGDFLGPLQQVPLLSHPRLGSFNGADLKRFLDQGTAADNYGLFRALLDATPAEDIAVLGAQVDRLIDAIRRADTALAAQADGDTSTDFAATYAALTALKAAVQPYLPRPEIAPEPAAEGLPIPAGAVGGAPAVLVAGFSGAIGSRADVERALDAICDYYAKVEPNSPVPLALRRARAWIGLDFMAVLEDIAPGGLDEATRILVGKHVDSAAVPTESTGESGW